MRMGHEPAVKFGRRLLDESVMPLIRLNPEGERQAWAVFQQYRDQRFSFVDCSSFAVMVRFGIPGAFAFDEDFRRFSRWVVHPAI